MNCIEVKAVTPVSFKNTITIPQEIMIVLGLHPRDNVLLELVDGHVRLRRASKVNLADYIPAEQLAQSDSLKLPDGYTVEYQVQKVVKKVVARRD